MNLWTDRLDIKNSDLDELNRSWMIFDTNYIDSQRYLVEK